MISQKRFKDCLYFSTFAADLLQKLHYYLCNLISDEYTRSRRKNN